MVNDAVIIGGLSFLFVMIGFAVPFINAEFSSDYALTGDTNPSVDEEEFSPVSGWSVFLSILGMATWSFGIIPVWLDVIFIPIRVLFWFVVARNIWVGGGA